MEAKIKIIVSERKELLRKSLVHLLMDNRQFEIIDEVINGKELIEKLKSKKVDLVITELETKEINCYATIDTIRSRFPLVKIIVLGDCKNDKIISELMSRRVNGFVCLESEVNGLFTAIECVFNKGYYFDNTASNNLLREIINDKKQNSQGEFGFKGRELDVMKGICDGKSNKEMGELLNLSSSTIDFYRSRVYAKTNCRNIASVIKYAIKHGIVSYA